MGAWGAGGASDSHLDRLRVHRACAQPGSHECMNAGRCGLLDIIRVSQGNPLFASGEDTARSSVNEDVFTQVAQLVWCNALSAVQSQARRYIQTKNMALLEVLVRNNFGHMDSRDKQACNERGFIQTTSCTHHTHLQGNTLLHIACQNGNKRAVKFLLKVRLTFC